MQKYCGWKKVAAELQANKSLFIIFDEMFRGTNVKDAHEAAMEITIALPQKEQHVHHLRLYCGGRRTIAADPFYRVSLPVLPCALVALVPEYTYKLERGDITADRHGMIIIRNKFPLETLKPGRKRAAT